MFAVDALELFGLGFSYGGFESLAIHCDPQLKRTVTKPNYGGPLIRLSVGLEEPEDLIADLDQALHGGEPERWRRWRRADYPTAR